MIKIILATVLAGTLCPAADLLYSNTATDQQFSVFYSASGYTEIGDQIHMVSSGTPSTVSAQFFNDGSDASFDAVLRFYDVGTPVGSQIGADILATGNLIASNTSQTVTFSDIGVSLPQDVIFTLQVQNVSAGGDIGVNLFDPPEVGSSDDTFFIANDGSGFSQASTNLGIDNLYLQVTTVPEPAPWSAIGGLLALAVGRKLARSLAS